MITPRVSVFIPAWNREALVGEAVASILAQRFSDFECLVVDDGSTDRTAEVVAGFDDPRVRLERNEKNLGIPATRNRGIDLARGDYLALLDSDDLALPDRLDEQVRYLDAHPEVAVLGSWAQAMKADGSPERRIHRCPATRPGLAFVLCFRGAPRQSTLMIRREVLAEARYDERCTVAQDLELLGRLARDHEIRALQKPLIRFRHHPDRVTEQPRPDRAAIRRRIFEARLREAGLSPSPEEVDRHLLLTGRSARLHEALGEGLDSRFVRWAGAWLEDLAQRKSEGPSLHPEVRAEAARIWGKVLRQAVRSGALGRALPFDAAPRLSRALGMQRIRLQARGLFRSGSAGRPSRGRRG